jgi:hypothetical protein
VPFEPSAEQRAVGRAWRLEGGEPARAAVAFAQHALEHDVPFDEGRLGARTASATAIKITLSRSKNRAPLALEGGRAHPDPRAAGRCVTTHLVCSVCGALPWRQRVQARLLDQVPHHLASSIGAARGVQPIVLFDDGLVCVAKEQGSQWSGRDENT